MLFRLIFPILIFTCTSCGLTEIRESEPKLNVLHKNQRFCIALEEDHSKGETWQMVKDVNSNAFENLGSNWHGQEKGVRFNLKASHSGIYRIRFLKTRMGEEADERSFIIFVRVQ